MPDRSPAVQPSSQPGVRIDRCVCLNRRFADLLPLTQTREFSLAELRRDTGCGNQCGLCLPYLRRMLSTGETVFHQVLEAGTE